MFWYGVAANVILAVFTLGGIANSEASGVSRAVFTVIMAAVFGFTVTATIMMK